MSYNRLGVMRLRGAEFRKAGAMGSCSDALSKDRRSLYYKFVDCLLEAVEEAGGFEAVHLGVVELEGDRQRGLKESSPVFAPSQEGIREHFGIDAHHSVDFA